MTTTATPPPPGAPSVEDIPGVTRRHRLSDLYHERTNFQFIKHSRRWLILSGTLIVISLLLLGVRGLNFGIDFEGGTQWQVQMTGGRAAKIADARDVVKSAGLSDAKVSILSPGTGAPSVKVQAEVLDDPLNTLEDQLASYAKVPQAQVLFEPSGDGGTITFTTAKAVTPTDAAIQSILKANGVSDATVTVKGSDVTITLKKIPVGKTTEVAAALAKYAGTTTDDVNITTVGPTWGHEVSQKAIKALIIFFLLLAVYLTVRFEWKMSAAAIVAVIHDIIFTVGIYALFRFPVTPATVTAFLTILGFSLYDTVVVFDKIIEYQKSMTATGRLTYGEMVNKALNAVLMRSLSTSLVALLPVMSLLFVGAGVFGATSLEDFALALAAGLFIGSYSSIFVAAPLLAWWKEKEPRYRALADRRRRTTLAAASAATGVPVVAPDDEIRDADEALPLGVPGPPAVPRAPIQARPRQQRGKKRR
jgi:preprotein translocase subunit SecF